MRAKFLPDEYLAGRVTIADGQQVVRAIIYARVSHEDSALSDLCIPQQVAACREECDRREWEVVGIYQDAGKSAYSDSAEREGFQDAIRAAIDSQATGEPVGRIIVDKLDRFSRDEDVNLTYKRQILPQHGVQVFSVAERFEGGAGPGRTMERITEAMAIGRSEEIARDTMRALVQNAQTGNVCGGKPPWGYLATKTAFGTDSRGNTRTRTNWTPDPKRRADVTRLFEMLSHGLPISRVAEKMNEEDRPSPSGGRWGKTTVHDLARRVYIYRGEYVWNMGHVIEWRDEGGMKRKTHRIKDPQTWVRATDAHEALIPADVAALVRERFPLQDDSPQTFERQARKLRGKPQPGNAAAGQPADRMNNRSRGSAWLLTSLAQCGECGGGLVSYVSNRKRKDGTTWRAYRCGAYHRDGAETCRSYYIPAERLDHAVLQGVAERLSSRFGGKDTKAYLRQLAQRTRTQASRQARSLQTGAAKREKQILRVVDLGISGGLDADACNARISSLRAEAAEMRDRQRIIEEVMESIETAAAEAEALLRSVDDLLLTWNLLEPAEQRERLRQVVSLIVVEPELPGGGSNSGNRATIHFRSLLGDQEARRVALREQVAQTTTAPEHQCPQAVEDLRADVDQYIGSPTWTRTTNTLVNSQTLYH